MTSANDEPVDLFHASVPKSLLGGIVRIAASTYAARDAYQPFDESEVRDTWPMNRRGRIECEMRRFARGFDGVTAKVESNPKGNNHTVIETGRVSFTQSFVKSPGEIVRPAVFREQLVRSNRPFFPSMADMEPTPSPAARLCAIIIHGTDSDDERRVGFMDVVFPSPDGRTYLDDRIHLIGLLDETHPIDEEAKEETIPDDLPLDQRDDVENEEGA